MRNYILRRLLLNVPVVLLILTAVFMITRVTPRDVVELMLEEAQVSGAISGRIWRRR